MLQVVSCITEQHDLRLVVLAGIVCVLASLAAMTMLRRASATDGRLRRFWTLAGGIVAGAGIWSTHFIAMLAFQPGLPVAYDLGPTLLSIVIAMAMSALGFALALRPRALLLGGAVAGAAIGTMHFVGMSGLHAPAIAVWNPTYVVAAWAIGIALSVVAIYGALRGKTIADFAGATLLFTLAICGLHFTAMTAVTYFPDSSVAVPQSAFDPSALAIMIASAAILVVILGFVGALVDNHLASRAREESRRLRQHVRELEATKAKLEMTSSNLAAALVAAQAANKSKSEFLANMSHELRTPLNAVLGFSDMMLEEMFGPLGSPRYREYLKDIRNSGAHLLALINDILDLSRLDAGIVAMDERIVDPNDAVADAVRLVTKLATTAGIEIVAVPAPGMPRIRADARRVRQVLLNLLGNALKFTPKGGRVTLTVSRRADGLAVEVADSGIGISAEHLPHVTERFYQIDSKLERKYEGAGLGLPLAKEFMALHGGTLELQSMPGAGTTATMLFPEARIVHDDAGAGEITRAA